MEGMEKRSSVKDFEETVLFIILLGGWLLLVWLLSFLDNWVGLGSNLGIGR